MLNQLCVQGLAVLVIWQALISHVDAPRPGNNHNGYCEAQFLGGQVAGYCTASTLPTPICCHYMSVIFNSTEALSCAVFVAKSAGFTQKILLEQYMKCSASEAMRSQMTGSTPDVWATCPRPHPCPELQPCPELICPPQKTIVCPQEKAFIDHSGNFWKNDVIQFGGGVLLLVIVGYYVVKILKKTWYELSTWNTRNVSERATPPSVVPFSPSAAVPILATLGVGAPHGIELAVQEGRPLLPRME